MADMIDMDGMEPLSDVTGAIQSNADSSAAPPPQLLATLHPLGPRVRRPFQIAVTRLGTKGIAALAAWSSSNAPVFQSIDDKGAVSTLKTPLP